MTVGLVAAAMLAWQGCSSESSDGDGTTTTTTSSTTQTASTTTPTTDTGGAGGMGATGGQGGADGGAGGLGCNAPAFVAVAEDAGPYMSAFVYLAQDTLATPVDVLTFELTGGTPAVGTLPITSAGYDTCVNCVLLYRDCDANLANCAKTLIAQGGSIEVSSTGSTGDTFAGTLHEAELVEVTIDGNGVTAPVSGGEQYCQAPYAFSAVIQ